MSQADVYWNKFKKLKEAVELYKSMDLLNFISQSLSYSGFDLGMMDNVYINEKCDLPDTYGCYKEGDTVYSYVINDRGQKLIKSYTQDKLLDFIVSFVLTAPNESKWIGNHRFCNNCATPIKKATITQEMHIDVSTNDVDESCWKDRWGAERLSVMKQLDELQKNTKECNHALNLNKKV